MCFEVAFVHYGGYHYVTTNPMALTKKYSDDRSINDLKYNVQRTADFIIKKSLVIHIPMRLIVSN